MNKKIRVLRMGDADWWKVSAFHKKEYWELKEQGCVWLPVEMCSAELNKLIKK